MVSQLAVLSLAIFAIGGQATPVAPRATSTPAVHLLSDISKISRYWGQISTYADNADNYFGVHEVGLPDGCQIEQAHLLQRHANRFPTGGDDDGGNDQRFAVKLTNFTKSSSKAGFSGPLEFLNTYRYIMGSGLLTGIGAAAEVTSGVQFWNKYGRTLYNATTAQLAYNATAADGKNQSRPVLRTTGQSRIENSQINWSLGFFGASFEAVPDPKLKDAVNPPYDVVIIPEGGTENNTLASYDSCINSDDDVIGYLGDSILFQYIPLYLKNATARMQQYAPKGFTFNSNDTYAMQSICAYETGYIGRSDFCTLFTEEEWVGFEQSLDIEYYYDYSFGNPTGRAQGIGYIQELTARLTKQYLTSSNSSVNYTIDNNAKDFPLDRPFYADFSHDDILISALTAISLDYLKDAPNITAVPASPNRHFILSHLTPFGARLTTEVIGCTSSAPTAKRDAQTQYYPEQYGYDKSTAQYKFIRMRLNNGILPLSTISGGSCAGREDGLCAMDKFLSNFKTWDKEANYQYACFAKYNLTNPLSGKDYDGTIGL